MWSQRPHSPNSNAVDCCVQGILQETVFKTYIATVIDMKQLIRAWPQLGHAFIVAAVKQWRRRPSACVKAEGGHLEHRDKI